MAVESQEEIVVIRSARKTISLTVNENGAIVVKAPKFVKDAEIARVRSRVTGAGSRAESARAGNFGSIYRTEQC